MAINALLEINRVLQPVGIRITSLEEAPELLVRDSIEQRIKNAIAPIIILHLQAKLNDIRCDNKYLTAENAYLKVAEEKLNEMIKKLSNALWNANKENELRNIREERENLRNYKVEQVSSAALWAGGGIAALVVGSFFGAPVAGYAAKKTLEADTNIKNANAKIAKLCAVEYLIREKNCTRTAAENIVTA